jgi:glycosyltransferase involved in cell wall biosynthesis
MIEQMRILLIHQPYRIYGGEDRVFEQERDAFIRVLGKDQVWTYGADAANTSTWQLPFHLFNSQLHYKKVFDLVKEHRIQIVHVHNFFPWLSTSIFRAAKDAGAAVVHTLHNYRRWCIKGELFRTDTGICEACIEQRNRRPAIRHRCYRNSTLQSIAAAAAFYKFEESGDWDAVDKFIVLTRFQEEWVLQRGIPKAKLVFKPNWIEPFPLQPIEARDAWIWVGRLEPSKGIDLALDAFQQVQTATTLTIVGTGSLEESLRKKYSHDARIHWMGAVSAQEARKLIGQARYLLQTSLWYETFGLTILEAMQMGIPVVGFSIGTRKELIEHGKNGFLCAPHELATTIEMASAYPLYHELSQNAVTFASTYETEQVLADQLMLYRSLMKTYA